MKPALLGLAVLFAPAFVQASLWQGTIVETITSSTDPSYAAGETFTGQYDYMSPTVDGTFDVDRAGSTYANPTLTGTLFTGGVGGGFVPLQAAPYADNHITVIGGVVTAFTYQDQTGGNAYIGGPGPGAPIDFSFYPLSSPSTSYTILGTIRFSDPVDPPASVPDTMATDLLLGLGLLCLGLGRRLFVK